MDKDHNLIEVGLMEWANWFESADRRIGRTKLYPDIIISTVFLGIDHSWGDGPPLLFETMIFAGGNEGHYCDRCSTYVEALAMHEQGVKWAKKHYISLLTKYVVKRHLTWLSGWKSPVRLHGSSLLLDIGPILTASSLLRGLFRETLNLITRSPQIGRTTTAAMIEWLHQLKWFVQKLFQRTSSNEPPSAQAQAPGNPPLERDRQTSSGLGDQAQRRNLPGVETGGSV